MNGLVRALPNTVLSEKCQGLSAAISAIDHMWHVFGIDDSIRLSEMILAIPSPTHSMN